MKVSVRHAAQMASLHQHSGLKVKEIIKMFTMYSKASVYRYCKKQIGEEDPVDNRKNNKGRPPILTPGEQYQCIKSLLELRETEGSFSSPRVALHAGISKKVCNKTVRNVLNKAGYHYCRSRKKGLLKIADLKTRIDFCETLKNRNLGQNFWNKHIAIYLDGKGFQYKTKPLDQARAPSACEWKKKNEGLNFNCTAKGQKEGCVNVNFMVGISYTKGVVLCEHYQKSITGQKMEDIIKNAMPDALEKSIDPNGRRILQDGCPRQNCKKAKKAFEEIEALIFKIPPRSPDLNPIENFFHLVTKKLKRQVIENKIEAETKAEFKERVKNTMLNFDIQKIDKIIESMDRRVDAVIDGNGCRTKY